MAILEVGKDRTFMTIGSAVEAARSGDEIRISSGSYEEAFCCTKKLTFTGVPLDMTDCTTYPVIDGIKDEVTVVLKECSFSNLIFSADYTLDLERLNKLEMHKALEWDDRQDLCKRIGKAEKHQMPYCIGIEASCAFRNCAFIGSRKAGAGIGLQKDNQKVVFTECIFFGNLERALFVNSRMKNTDVALDGCFINYGDYGIEIEGYGTVSLNKTVISNLMDQAVSAGDDSRILVSDSEIFDCGGGIVPIERSKLLMIDSKITGCHDFGILASDKADLSIYGCNISRNSQDGIMLMDESKASIHDTVLESNLTNGITLRSEAVASFYDTEIVHNKNGIDLSESSSAYISRCTVHNNIQCDLQQTDNVSVFAEKTSFHNNGMEYSFDEPFFVGVIVAKKSEITFSECDFSAEMNENVKLTLSAEDSKVIYRNCSFHDAEDGIGVFDNSRCIVDTCRFCNIQNLEIKLLGYKDASLKICDTKLNRRTMAQFQTA